MADAIVGSLVDKLGSMLLDKAIHEADRLIHFDQNLRRLVDKLRPLQDLLIDAQQKRKRSMLIQNWLLELQDVVYDAEDLFEDCQSSLPLDIAAAAASAGLAHPRPPAAAGSAHPRPPHRCCFPWASSAAASSSAAGSAHPHPRPRPRCSCFSWVSRAGASAADAASHLPFRHEMGKRVDELMNRITDLTERSRDFHLTQIAYSELAFNRSTEPTSPKRVFLREESETVGIDDSIGKIISWLSDKGSSHFQTRRRIAVVGMGGMGKTHLLTHLFKTERGNFEKSAWLTVSQSFNSKALQEMLGKEISPSVEGLTVEAARDRIFESLRGKRSLLILDDVWPSGRQLLDDLGVPDEDGCKVIISTRDRGVADYMRAEICEMPRLSEENSWILFCRHAFSSGVAPKELEAVAQEMAKKCRRLPLAIKTVAASMYTRRLPNEWSDALDRLSKVDLSSEVIPVLEMSYEALPSHLKLCFIFCSAFPEDYEINCDFLKSLWIGEGIVSGGKSTKPSDVAEGYLNDLISLCLLEATYSKAGFRACDFCKMHDLLREMALGKSQNEMRCFFQAGKEINELSLQQLSGRRRASLMACDFQIPLRNSAGLESLRTLLLAENRHLQEIDADFLPNLRHLRVLDLSHTRISVLPQSIGSLKHLRVLDISWSKIEELPETVSQLRHLQHLNVNGSGLKKLPMEIGQLKCLTYLDLHGFSIELMPKAVSLLTSLETLRLPSMYNLLGGNELRFEDLQDLANLRVFEGRLSASENVQMVAEGTFCKMDKMRDLSLKNVNDDFHTPRPSEGMRELDVQTRLPSDMERMRELESVFLSGFVPPDCLSSFPSLVSLTLEDCDCEEYPRLDRLPNLRDLSLSVNKSCKEFPKEFGRAGGFPKLEELNIEDFENLEELPELENGAMPMLKKLFIKWLLKVKKMPEGLNQLSTLQELKIEDCYFLPESEFEKLRTNLPHLNLKLMT